MEKEPSKSQKRIERQKRRDERRLLREKRKTAVEATVQKTEEKKKKSLPGFLAKHRHEIYEWLKHYMVLFCKAEDAQIPYFKDMSREERNKVIDEYVKLAEFKKMLKAYLDDEKLKDGA